GEELIPVNPAEKSLSLSAGIHRIGRTATKRSVSLDALRGAGLVIGGTTISLGNFDLSSTSASKRLKHHLSESMSTQTSTVLAGGRPSAGGSVLHMLVSDKTEYRYLAPTVIELHNGAMMFRAPEKYTVKTGLAEIQVRKNGIVDIDFRDGQLKVKA